MIKAMLQRLTRLGEYLEITWSQDDQLWTVSWWYKGKEHAAKDEQLEKALSAVWVEAAVSNSK